MLRVCVDVPHKTVLSGVFRELRLVPLWIMELSFRLADSLTVKYEKWLMSSVLFKF